MVSVFLERNAKAWKRYEAKILGMIFGEATTVNG